MPISNRKRGALTVAALTLLTLASYALARPGEAPVQRPSIAAPAPAPTVIKPAQAPIAVTTATGQVTLTAKVDRNALLAGSDGQAHVALTLRAQTADGDAAARSPIDALVVLDISGSMAGQKLDYAKQALHQLIDRLTGEDRFSLVTYESEARVLLPLQAAQGGAVAGFHRVVDNLETAGGTNMSAGLDLALRELQQHNEQGRNARVLLLSDGHANEGDSSLAGLTERARKFTRHDDVLSAMGIGDDFNEDLMTSIADRGTGNFYYLSKVAVLGRYFDAELRAAAQTVASALELRFTPAPGVELLELAGYPIEQSGTVLSVRPGNLYAGQERLLWATIKAPTDALRDVALGSFSLRFKRNEELLETPSAALPELACVSDSERFEQAIVRDLWEEYVATEQYSKSKVALGRAVSEGTEVDIDREQKSFESNRSLAEKLGSKRVLDQLGAMASEVDAAKKSQRAPAAERQYDAKQMKSKAIFSRRKDAYNDDPWLGL